VFGTKDKKIKKKGRVTNINKYNLNNEEAEYDEVKEGAPWEI
jgi:hypothetical protein